MNLLELKRQVAFVRNLNKIVYCNSNHSAGNFANQSPSANNKILFDLNDSILRMALLPESKFRRIIELALYLLILQDNSLILSGKKRSILINIFSSSTRNLANKHKLDAKAPPISLELLQSANFLSKSCYIICDKFYMENYSDIYQKLMQRWPMPSNPQPELVAYWQNFATDNIKSALLLAFELICSQSFQLKFEYTINTH